MFGPDNEKWVAKDSGEGKWKQKRYREKQMEDALAAWTPPAAEQPVAADGVGQSAKG